MSIIHTGNNLGTKASEFSVQVTSMVFPLQHLNLPQLQRQPLPRLGQPIPQEPRGPPSTAPPTRTTAQRNQAWQLRSQAQLMSPGLLPASARLPQALQPATTPSIVRK